MDESTPTATSLGAGLVLDDDHSLNIVLLVGSEDGSVAVPMDVVTAEGFIISLQKMVDEARIVQEAVMTMPLASAKQYMSNWASRQWDGP